jgi:hypothetical protein
MLPQAAVARERAFSIGAGTPTLLWIGQSIFWHIALNARTAMLGD